MFSKPLEFRQGKQKNKPKPQNPKTFSFKVSEMKMKLKSALNCEKVSKKVC